MKKNVFLILMVFACFSVFGFAGFQPTVPLFSGEYVYYEDLTFPRETYIGFLYYDDGTISVRYFAPAVKKPSETLPSKDIEILFTISTEKDYLELTGEKILSVITPEDTDIINYLHDIIYEFSARRKKAGNVEDSVATIQNFPQFSGEVKMVFDASIPVFNLKQIITLSGNELLRLSTAGRLISSQDKSFSSYNGFSKPTPAGRNLKLDKKAIPQEIQYENAVVKLDSQWKQPMENIWTLGNDAILTMAVLEFQDAGDTSEDALKMLEKRFSLGTDYSYPKMSLQKVKFTADSFSLSNVFYMGTTGALKRDFKTVKKIGKNKFMYAALTIFDSSYAGNEKYFENIMNSFIIRK